MRVLLLSSTPERLAPIFHEAGDEIVVHEGAFDAASPPAAGAHFAVSYGYRHILSAAALALFPARIVNLHISLLPFNRGADPNLWSFLEDTPKGVSVHHIDRGIDSGDLVAQQGISFPPGGTLASTYEILQQQIVQLFGDVWISLRNGNADRRRQPPGGSFHRSADKAPYMHLLTDGWNTPVQRLVGRALARASP